MDKLKKKRGSLGLGGLFRRAFRLLSADRFPGSPGGQDESPDDTSSVSSYQAYGVAKDAWLRAEHFKALALWEQEKHRRFH